jgi:hypothetical protein
MCGRSTASRRSSLAEARSWVGTHDDASNCNPFSRALGYACEAWCSDFIVYVWQ